MRTAGYFPRAPSVSRNRAPVSRSPPSSFQDLILVLQRFWAAQGCVLLQPYDMEVGAGTFHPATTLRALGPEPWRAAYVQPSPAADGRPLRREPEPAAALLSVSGDPQALARRPPGPLPREPGGDRHRSPGRTTSASSRTTGRARRSAPGASAGRSGATAWRSPSSPISSRSAASTASRCRAS